MGLFSGIAAGIWFTFHVLGIVIGLGIGCAIILVFLLLLWGVGEWLADRLDETPVGRF